MDDGEVTSLRHEVNPAIALNTLTNIYKKVQQYQLQLRQLARKIHQVYAEGPIVSGWLASEASLNAAVKYSNRSGSGEQQGRTQPSQNLETVDVALFRHGDTNDLMNYLSALESAVLENGKSANNSSAPSSATIDPQVLSTDSHTRSSGTGSPSKYYLCRLTSCGQIQTEHCPADQVPVLSMAIARYRRLNQLIKRKQTIETKLQAVIDVLGDIETVLAD